MKQHTLKRSYKFTGKGLHTGLNVRMILDPAPENFGLVFKREDLGEVYIKADIANLSSTHRSTALRANGAEVRTTEHLLSALTGLGVDNVLIRINAPELPILDGSAMKYVTAITADGLDEQDAEREYFEIKKRITYRNILTGSKIVMEPSDEVVYEVTIDFKSRVVGIQWATWDCTIDYASEIAQCRTFCFLREIKKLLKLGLIKGGDLGNALVIDEPYGYYNNAPTHFPNECARHKLLDLIGDFALIGHPIKGKIVAWKPGHRANSGAVRMLRRKNK